MIRVALIYLLPPILGVLLSFYVHYGERWMIALAVFVAWLHVRILIHCVVMREDRGRPVDARDTGGPGA